MASSLVQDDLSGRVCGFLEIFFYLAPSKFSKSRALTLCHANTFSGCRAMLCVCVCVWVHSRGDVMVSGDNDAPVHSAAAHVPSAALSRSIPSLALLGFPCGHG